MKSRIGLALGGGGARGIAHLGVWQRLRELGVEFHCIAGTSIGAIAGAIIAAGRVDEALKWCAESDWKKLPKLFMETQFTSKALTKGTRVEKLLAEFVGAKAFDELSTRFAAVATDLNTGERIVMQDGDLLSAVRASMSIPGVFRPVERDGRILIDGQLVDPIPIAACRAMGADKVIAVDINPPNAPGSAKPFAKVNIFDVLMNTLTIFNCEMTRRVLAEHKPDLLIRPDVGDVLALDFRNVMRLVEIGRQAVNADVAEKTATL
ncbi:MAG: patatin-like phospholipase family protein [Kiritimatiellae bacterium]|nr:patatin-like phospholipase family protein [Kiritimatiellia bacterium]